MDDAVKKYRQRRDARLKARIDEFNENDHPRDENGKFTSGGGGGSAPKKESGGKSSGGAKSSGKTWQEHEAEGGTWEDFVDEGMRGFMGGAWDTMNEEAENELIKNGWKSEEQREMSKKLYPKSFARIEKGIKEKKKEKFDVATARLADTDSDSRAQSIIADAMEDSDFSKEDTEKLADGYCERKGYGKSKTKRFKESVQIRLNEVKKAREKYTNEFLDKVPNYETEHEFVSDMRRMRHWEPINNDSIMRVFDSYCEYHGIKGTKKDKLFKAIGGEKK